MPNPRPLGRLREIRELHREAAELVPERDRLILEALTEGHSERAVAQAAGLSPGRIHQIARSR